MYLCELRHSVSRPRDLTHRPPRQVWCLSWLHLPARLSARYKDASPATFPATLSIHLSPSTLLIRPPSCLRLRRAPPSPACPLPPPKDTTRPVRKMLRALSCRPSDCGSDLDDDAEERAWISGSPATWPRDGLRCRTSAALLQAS
jgi:hypothetical protein